MLSPEQVQQARATLGISNGVSNPTVSSSNNSSRNPNLRGADLSNWVDSVRKPAATQDNQDNQDTSIDPSLKTGLRIPVISTLKDNVAKDATAGASRFTSGFKQINEGIDLNNPSFSKVGRGVLNEGAGALETVFSPVSAAFNTITGGKFSEAMSAIEKHLEDNKDSLPNKISDIPDFQKLAMANPHAGEVFNNLMTIATTLMGGKEGPEAIKGAVDTAADTISNTKNAVVDKATDVARNSEKDTWTKPTTIAKPAYNNATEIYNNALKDVKDKSGNVVKSGHDIADTLIKNNLRASDHIDMNGAGNKVYNTTETVEKLHADAAKMSKDMLRPALEKADKEGATKTPVHELTSNALDNLVKDKSITAENRKTLLSKLSEAEKALVEEHPQGLSLTDIHDEKIVRDLNAKRNPLGDAASNLEATKNEIIANAARKMLEDKAPKEIPVKEFNAELAKQHQAANYLEALHGKQVPKSILSRMAKTAAKVTGAAVGHGLGGGILAGVGGYHMGGMIESLIENVPNPIRNSLLKNLETTNPEAFTKVKDYLNNLDTKGSVSQPINNISNKANIEPQSTIPKPKSQIKDIPNKQGGFVSLGGKDVKTFSDFHPEDQDFLTNFSEKVKNKEPIPESLLNRAKETLEHYGYNAPASKTKLADIINTAKDSADMKDLSNEIEPDLHKPIKLK